MSKKETSNLTDYSILLDSELLNKIKKDFNLKEEEIIEIAHIIKNNSYLVKK